MKLWTKAGGGTGGKNKITHIFVWCPPQNYYRIESSNSPIAARAWESERKKKRRTRVYGRGGGARAPTIDFVRAPSPYHRFVFFFCFCHVITARLIWESCAWSSNVFHTDRMRRVTAGRFPPPPESLSAAAVTPPRPTRSRRRFRVPSSSSRARANSQQRPSASSVVVVSPCPFFVFSPIKLARFTVAGARETTYSSFPYSPFLSVVGRTFVGINNNTA